MFLLALFLVLPVGAEAAEIFFEAETNEIAPGQQFRVDVLLDPEGETLNAVQGELVFPAEFVEIREIRDGGSIVSLWVERLALVGESRVRFAGVMPGGFAGVLSPHYEGVRAGLLFTLVVEGRREGAGEFRFAEAEALLHDGQGIRAELSMINFQFSISDQVSGFTFQVSGEEDTTPPEAFEPQIARDPSLFAGKWFLVFAAQDKGFGISHYEVCEGWRRCEKAESPYLLKNQRLNEKITVKAIDKAGNERVVELAPSFPQKWYENALAWGILMVIVIVTVFAFWRIWRKPKRFNA